MGIMHYLNGLSWREGIIAYELTSHPTDQDLHFF
jgi:hypothetical protein